MSEKRSEFERNLFKNGLLTLQEDDQRLKRLVKSGSKDLRFVWKVWLNHFDGKVPHHWASYWDAGKDLEQADKQGVQLSQVLKDAAVNHPNPNIAYDAAKYQKLDELQIAILLSRALVGGSSTYKEIIELQQGKTVEDYIIKDIINKASHLRWHILAGGGFGEEERNLLKKRFAWPIEVYNPTLISKNPEFLRLI